MNFEKTFWVLLGTMYLWNNAHKIMIVQANFETNKLPKQFSYCNLISSSFTVFFFLHFSYFFL